MQGEGAMKINRKELLDILQILQPGIASENSLVEQASCFVFNEDMAMTFNDEIAIQHPLVGDGSLDMKAAVQAREFFSILKSFSCEEIELEIDNSELTISTESDGEAGIRLEQEIRLPIEEMSQPKKFKKIPNPDNFITAINSCIFSASGDASQPIFTCLYVKPDFIQSCDNSRATIWDTETGADSEGYLLPASSARHLASYKPVKISHTEGWAHFKNRLGTIFSCRTHDGKYPDISSFFKVDGDEIEFPKDLISAINNATIMADNNSLIVSVNKKKLTVEGKGDNGWFKKSLKMKSKAGECTFKINPSNFIQILKMFRTAIIGDKSILFEKDNFKHVVAMAKEN